MKHFLAITLLLGLTCPLAACQTSLTTDTSPHPETSCTVIQVFDGDTLACDTNGDGDIQRPTEHIRLLGIDAPETRHSRKKREGIDAEADEPYAIAASEWLRNQTTGKTVWLEMDTQPTDTYGRTLAFVYLTPHPTQACESLNAQLVAQGLAASLFMGANRKHQTSFDTMEWEAHNQRRGIWKLKSP